LSWLVITTYVLAIYVRVIHATAQQRCVASVVLERKNNTMKIKDLEENWVSSGCWSTASCGTGPSGKSLEEHEDEKHELGWNVAEDLHIHMKNDPMFYRKQYYPCMSRLQDQLKQGNPIDVRKEMLPMIEKAKDHYCAKYNLSKRPEDLLYDEEVDALVEKIYGEEMELFREGDY